MTTVYVAYEEWRGYEAGDKIICRVFATEDAAKAWMGQPTKGVYWVRDYDEFEVEQGDEELPTLKFRVGQRVRVVRGSHSGMLGTVLTATPELALRLPYEVSLDNDTDEHARTQGRCYNDTWLESAE